MSISGFFTTGHFNFPCPGRRRIRDSWIVGYSVYWVLRGAFAPGLLVSSNLNTQQNSLPSGPFLPAWTNSTSSPFPAVIGRIAIDSDAPGLRTSLNPPSVQGTYTGQVTTVATGKRGRWRSNFDVGRGGGPRTLTPTSFREIRPQPSTIRLRRQ